ncbi:DUF4282 domain-containing protein [Humibacillus xanthopallidus]|uniref:Uncharacterized protein DUF4282 n=1 Tax=Humibacillus xanthopallidus TaxID=412689 RepID=A0A543HUP5_9MICO|nr:DUF4282 domain-containing protein [Humibacillus xanthopallidus]TQM62071.1 uncharacterized protein DUF4282 [Humibacillus xanthopallidus]
MSDQNPPEQGSFGSPPPGSDPLGAGPGATPPPGGSTPPPPPPAAVSPAGPPSQPAQPSMASSAVSSGAGAIVDSSTGFFPALFDFSFNSFVTPKIVRFVYVLATIWAAVMYVIVVISAFTQSVTSGLIALVFGPLVAIIWLAVVRIGLEFGISVVRMSEDVHKRLPQA